MSRPGGAAKRLPCSEMAAGASFGEDRLAAAQRVGVFGQVRAATGRIFQVMRVGAREEEARHVRRLQLRRLPVDRVFSRVGDLDWRDRLTADERPEVEQPLLAEEADVEIDPIERAERADRIGAVLQHPRRPGRRRRREELRQRIGRRNEVVELLVVESTAGEGFLSPSAWRVPCAGRGNRPRSSCADC